MMSDKKKNSLIFSVVNNKFMLFFSIERIDRYAFHSRQKIPSDEINARWNKKNSRERETRFGNKIIFCFVVVSILFLVWKHMIKGSEPLCYDFHAKSYYLSCLIVWRRPTKHIISRLPFFRCLFSRFYNFILILSVLPTDRRKTLLCIIFFFFFSKTNKNTSKKKEKK